MATVNKDFKIKNGLVVEGSTATVNGSNVLTQASTEFLQDTVAGMVDGSHTNLTVSYNDTTGKLTFTAENGVADSTTDNLSEGSTNKYFTDERAQDAVGNALGTGLEYNDGTGAIGITSSVTTNSGSQTLTNKTISGADNTLTNISNGSLSNSAITINGTSVSLGGSRTLGTDDISEGSTNKYFTDERAQDAIGIAIANGTQTNISVTYDDSTNALSFNASGGVSSLTGTANEVEVSSSTGAVTIGLPNDVTIGGNLTISGTPTNSNHAATVGYVDAATAGLNVHEAARAATTENVNLASALENGDTLDGVTLATGNRVLVKNQTTKSQNGIYVVQASGAAVRAADYNSVPEVDAGDFVFVEAGTTNGKTGWVQTNTIATLGTDEIAFTQFSGAGTYLAGNGLSLTGNTFAIDTATTVDLNTTQTLTNKTLTSPTVSGLYLSDNNIVVEGTSNTHETTLTITDPTQDNTITFKDATGTVAFVSDIPTSTDGLSEGSTNKYFTDERAQDAVATAIANGTHSNITITYDDATNKFTFAAENGVADSTTDNLTEGSTNLYFTTERAEDAVGGMVTSNTETGISVTYDDGTGKLNFSVDDQFPSKSTTNLAEGTNLYFTDARAVSALEAVVPDFTAVELNSLAKQIAATTGLVATASTVTAYSFPKATYRSAKFLVKTAYGSHTEVSEVVLTLDSSDNIAITEYATVGTNGSTMTISADIDGVNVRLRVTTLNNNSTVNVVGTLLA
jgi:hypothetical protein